MGKSVGSPEYWNQTSIESTMKPSQALQFHREAIRSAVLANQALNPRIFGSVLHGNDTNSSDLDILVDPIPGKTTLLSLHRIQQQIEGLLGVKTDVQTPLSLHEKFREAVVREAMPL